MAEPGDPEGGLEQALARTPLGPASLLAVCLIPAVIRALYYPDHPGSDDAFIHLAVIGNLVSDGAWGVNPGRSVNLSTSPLFTLAFAGLARWVGNPLAWGQALSVAASAATVAISFGIARALCRRWGTSLTAAALVAANVHLWRWTGTFLETAFASALLLGILFYYVRFIGLDAEGAPRGVGARYFGLGGLIGLGVLLRPEMGLLGVVLFAHDGCNRRPGLLRHHGASLLGLVAVLTPYLLWAHSTFGAVVPTSFAAKTRSELSFGVTPTLVQVAKVFASGAPGAAFAILCAIVAVGFRSPAGRRPLRLGLRRSTVFWGTPLAVVLFYYLKTEGLGSAARYLLPFMGALPLLAVALWEGRPRAPRGRVFALALALQLATALTLNHVRVAPVLRRMQTEYVAAMSEAAAELDRRCRRGDTVLVWMDIGVVSWRHNKSCEIADGGRLASPELAGLTLPEMVERTGSRFVLESQGTPGGALALPGHDTTLVWSRTYRSHSVAWPDRIYVARLYALATGDRR